MINHKLYFIKINRSYIDDGSWSIVFFVLEQDIVLLLKGSFSVCLGNLSEISKITSSNYQLKLIFNQKTLFSQIPAPFLLKEDKRFYKMYFLLHMVIVHSIYT